jgi:hypothetical protein
MRWPWRAFAELVGWLGFVALVVGLGIVYMPLALIVGGGVLFVIGALGSRSVQP